MFSHLQHKIFVVETKKINQTDLIWFFLFVCFFFVSFFVSATKNFRKTKKFNMGHAEAFIGDCSILRFLLLSHKKCFRVPLALIDCQQCFF